MWPPLTLKPDELHEIVNKLAPRNGGPGLGTGGGARAHSQSGDGRVARDAGAHLEPRRQGLAHDVPARHQTPAAQTAERVRPESGPHAPARDDLSLRDHQDAHPRSRRHASRISSRRLCRARSGPRGAAGSGRSSLRPKPSQHHRRRHSQLYGQVSRGHDAGHAAGGSEQGLGRPRRTRMPAHHRRAGPGRREGRAAGMVSHFGRREDLHGQRRGEHGLDCPRPPPPGRVHARRAARSIC